METRNDKLTALMQLQKDNSRALSELQGLKAQKAALMNNLPYTNKEAWDRVFSDLAPLAPALVRHSYHIKTGIRHEGAEITLAYRADPKAFLEFFIGDRDMAMCINPESPFEIMANRSARCSDTLGCLNILRAYNEDLVRFIVGGWENCMQRTCEDLFELETTFNEKTKVKIAKAEQFITLLSDTPEAENTNDLEADDLDRE